MKKLLVLMLVLGMASLANATVMDVVLDGVGSLGHAGTSTDPLYESETIGVKIVLNRNPNPSYPGGTYDGYWLSMMDLDLHVSGPGSLSHTNLKATGEIKAGSRDAGFYPWYNSTVSATGLDRFGGSAMPPIKATAGTVDLVWDFVIHCDGYGYTILDLTIAVAGGTQHSNYGYPIAWLNTVEADLGDLVIHQVPEPATIALLGLGGLFLVRRRK